MNPAIRRRATPWRKSRPRRPSLLHRRKFLESQGLSVKPDKIGGLCKRLGSSDVQARQGTDAWRARGRVRVLYVAAANYIRRKILLENVGDHERVRAQRYGCFSVDRTSDEDRRMGVERAPKFKRLLLTGALWMPRLKSLRRSRHHLTDILANHWVLGPGDARSTNQ